MTVVFNRPVLAGGSCESLAVQIVAQDIVTNLFRDLVTFLPNINRHSDRFDSGPVLEDGFATGNPSHIVVTVHLTVATEFAGVVPMTGAF